MMIQAGATYTIVWILSRGTSCSVLASTYDLARYLCEPEELH